MTTTHIQSPLLNRTLVRTGGGVTATIGATALIGWLLGLPFLASLGQGLIPMAPSGAILFIVYGSLLATVRHPAHSRRARLAIRTIFAGGGMLAATLLALSLQGIYLDSEHFGIVAMGAVEGSPVGHMSPVTAFTFLLFSLLGPVVLAAPIDSVWRAKAAWWSAILIIAVYVMLLLAYLLGTPMFYGGTFIPPAATTSLAFTALASSLLALSRPLAWPDKVSFDQNGDYSFRTLAVLFIFLAAGIISAGYFYHRHHEKQSLSESERQLSAVADLKMGELLLWREERLTDAGIYHRNSAFASLVKSCFKHPGRRADCREIKTWLERIKETRNYDRLFVLDPLGNSRLTLPENAGDPLSPHATKMALEALRSDRKVIGDFYRNELSNRIYLDIQVPVFDPENKTVPLAVLVLRIDPEKYLYPFLQRWPNTSASAETLLVRREENEVLFLNELRFKKDTALTLRIPLERQEVPSVMAVMGREGIVRGVDYRGRPAIAALRTVPDSPWYLISKMDEAEIYAPLRERQWLTVLLVSTLLLSAGAGIGFIWRQQKTSHYKHYLAQAHRNEERLQSLLNVFQHETKDVRELLDFALKEALSMTASSYGYIYYYDEEKEQFSLNSWSPGVMQSCSVVNPQSLYALDKTGIWGEAVRQRRPIMVNDFTAPDPLKKGYPEGHVHLSRFLTIPLIEQDRIVAVVGVANKEDVYDDSDILQLTLLMGSVWKIAERKLADEALLRKETELTEAQKLAHIGSWYWDVKSDATTGSAELLRIYGLNPVTQNMPAFKAQKGRLYPDEDWEQINEAIENTLQTGTGYLLDVTAFRKGARIWVTTRAEVVRGVDGQIVGLRGTVQDITERKEKERELEQKNAEMERFTYTVSHDLKSPLVTVKSFVGFLEKDMAAGDSARIAKDIFYIKNAADRMSQLLDQILVMSRVGKVVTPPVQIQFTELVQEALELVAGSITEKGVLVQLVWDEPVILHGERMRLVEIWQNLIENAVKYMGTQAAPRIEAGFELKNSGPVFFVADNGMGIDPRYHTRIFSLFDKLDQKSEGTGLGLALVKRIVEMYEGKIWVESGGVGDGSCFRFTLPLAIRKQDDESAGGTADAEL